MDVGLLGRILVGVVRVSGRRLHSSTVQTIREGLESDPCVKVEAKALQQNSLDVLGDSFGDDAAWVDSDGVV